MNHEFHPSAIPVRETVGIMRRWKVFFGHFKDLAEYKTCTNLTDVKEEVDRVIEEYNESRYQWGQ